MASFYHKYQTKIEVWTIIQNIVGHLSFDLDTLISYEQYEVNYIRVGTIRNKVYVIKYFGFHYTCSCQEQTIHTREQLQFKC